MSESSERRELERRLRDAATTAVGGVDPGALAERAEAIDGVPVLAARVEVPDAKALLDVADRVKGRLGAGVIVLGTAGDGRVHLVASVAPSVVERGVRAGQIVKLAAEMTGGGWRRARHHGPGRRARPVTPG